LIRPLKLRHQCCERGIGRSADLGANQAFMHPCVADGTGPIAARRQRPHQPGRRAAAQWIQLRQLPPPRARRRQISPRFRRFRQPAHRVGMPRREPGAFARRPLLELGRVAEMEAVEEGTTVERHGLLQRAGVERLLELGHVERDDLAIEAQRIGALERVVANLLAEVVEQLMKGVPGRLGGAFGAERGDQPVTGDAALPPRCDERQEGDPAALLRHHRSSAIHQGSAAQGEQAERVARVRIARGGHEGLG
jgi:hypothetical protein